MSAAVFFSEFPGMIRALAAIDKLHLHIAAGDGNTTAIRPGDDYYLQPCRLAKLDTRASILMQARHKMLNMKVEQLLAVLSEMRVDAPCPTLKPKKSDLADAVIAQFTELDRVALVSQVKIALPNFKYTDVSRCWGEYMLVLACYKIRQPHENARHAMRTIDPSATCVHFDVFISQPAETPPDTIMTTFMPGSAHHSNKYVYRSQTLDGIKCGTKAADAKQIVVAAAASLLALMPEEYDPEWATKVDTMVHDHRQHITVTPARAPVLPPPLSQTQQHDMACRGGCGFYGSGEELLCSKCRMASSID